MYARYDGECDDCGGDIVAGDDEIVSDGSGGWVHADCAPEPEEPASAREPATPARLPERSTDDILADGCPTGPVVGGSMKLINLTTGDVHAVTTPLKDIVDLDDPVKLIDPKTGKVFDDPVKLIDLTPGEIPVVIDIDYATDTFLSRIPPTYDGGSDRVHDLVDRLRDEAVTDMPSPDRETREAAVKALAEYFPKIDDDRDAAVFLATVGTSCAACGGAVLKGHHRVTDAPSGDTVTHVECADWPYGPYCGRPRYVPSATTRKPPRGLRDDRYGRYTLMHPSGSGKVVTHSRVSTVKGAIADTYNLGQWKLRSALKGVGARPDLGERAAALDPENRNDREKLEELVKQALDAGGASRAANRGTALHAFCEMWERGEELEGVAPPSAIADVRAYAAGLYRAGLEVIPDMVERTTMTSRWDGVAGTFDNIYRTRDGRYVIGDKKTGKVGWDPDEMYAQFAMYAEGVHEYGVYDPETGLWSLPGFDIDLNVALIVHLPAGAATCTIYSADLARGRAHLDNCAETRRRRKAPKPPMIPYVPPPRVLPAGGWVELIESAPDATTVKALGREAREAGDLDDRVKAAGRSRLTSLSEQGKV